MCIGISPSERQLDNKQKNSAAPEVLGRAAVNKRVRGTTQLCRLTQGNLVEDPLSGSVRSGLINPSSSSIRIFLRSARKVMFGGVQTRQAFTAPDSL